MPAESLSGWPMAVNLWQPFLRRPFADKRDFEDQRKGFIADKPDLTLTINRSNLEQTMMGAKTLEAQIADGTAKVEGDVGVLKKLASTMIDFDPRFEIMPGTKARDSKAAHADAYKAVPRESIAE